MALCCCCAPQCIPVTPVDPTSRSKVRTFPEPKTDIFEAFGVYRKELCGFWCNSCFSLVSLGLSGMMSFGLISTVHPLLCCRDTHGRRIPFSIVTLSLQVGDRSDRGFQLGRGPGSDGHSPPPVPAPSQLLQPVFLVGYSLPLRTGGLCLPLAPPPLP